MSESDFELKDDNTFNVTARCHMHMLESIAARNDRDPVKMATELLNWIGYTLREKLERQMRHFVDKDVRETTRLTWSSPDRAACVGDGFDNNYVLAIVRTPPENMVTLRRVTCRANRNKPGHVWLDTEGVVIHSDEFKTILRWAYIPSSVMKDFLPSEDKQGAITE